MVNPGCASGSYLNEPFITLMPQSNGFARSLSAQMGRNVYGPLVAKQREALREIERRLRDDDGRGA